MSTVSQLKKLFLDTAVVVFGSGASQIIFFAALPILSDLYSVEHLGVYFFLNSIIAVIGPLSSGRIEMALVGHEPSDERLDILLSAATAILLVSFVLAALLFFYNFFSSFFGLSHFKNFSAFIVTGTALIGANQIFIYLCIVEQKFREIAIARIVQICSLVVLSISLAKFGVGVEALLIGHLIGLLLSVCYLFYSNSSEFRLNGPFSFLSKNLAHHLKKYTNFTLFLTPSDFFSNLCLSFPVFIVGFVYGMEEAGFLGLALRIISSPLSMIGGALGQVLLGNAHQLLRSNNQHFKILTHKLMIFLCLASIFLFIVFSTLGEHLVVVFLGEGWERSGSYVKYLGLLFAVQFMISPLSNLLSVFGKQREMLVYDCIRFFLMLSVTLAGFLFSFTSSLFVMFLMYSNIYGYALYIRKIVGELKRL